MTFNLESLFSDPFKKGDYPGRTPEGREVQVKVIESQALLYRFEGTMALKDKGHGIFGLDHREKRG